MTSSEHESLRHDAINTIRFLSVDAVERAKSGHPGAPMGMAAMAYTLWTRHLRFDPMDPKWADRDRVVLSNGHASMLLYSMLYLTGYDLSLDDLKNFRQWGSKTPGHPEYGFTPGVEVTTGPLGQGFANAVGMAIAEQFLASTFNKGAHHVVDHHTYVFMGDGCMMEGITSEAASLAGHLELGKLIAIYDDNSITIDGTTRISFTEDVARRFKSYGWHVEEVADGNDVESIDLALRRAKSKEEKPSLIICKTHIGFGSPHKQDTSKAHGSPLGKDEVRLTKEHLGWPLEPEFYLPDGVLEFYRACGVRSALRHEAWQGVLNRYEEEEPELSQAFRNALGGTPETGWEDLIKPYSPSDGAVATRNVSSRVLNALASSSVLK